MGTAKVVRSRDWLFSSRARKGLVRTFLVAAAMFGALVLLQGQELAPGPNTDSGLFELRLNSASTFQPTTQDYLISPDDELDIYVLDVPELSRQYRVSPTGWINVPLLQKPISAAGLTPERLSQVISEELRTSGMVNHSHVTVQVKQSRLHSVAIAGAVKKPQIYPIFGKTTLLDALSQAEGLAEDAGNTAIITRGDISIRAFGLEQGSQLKAGVRPANPRTVTVDLKRLMEEGDANLNLDLYPGDRVSVQRAGIVYVVGAVNRSGGYVLKNDREQMTVLKAVALAENLKSTAISKKAMIIRKNPQVPSGSEEIPVDLNKILSGRTPDRQLLANDILFVPDSSSKKAIHRAGEAAAQAAALLIYRFP